MHASTAYIVECFLEAAFLFLVFSPCLFVVESEDSEYGITGVFAI